MSHYDQAFYDAQKEGSLRSARKFLSLLWGMHTPNSVVDLGCGAGTWLKAAGELGAARLVGFDGRWNSQSNMLDPRIEFHPVDLDEPLPMQERFDMAMSLEVAEHLHPESSEKFVRTLVGLSDVVLFSAAYIDQGGTNHINERLHSDWAEFFAAHDYGVFDLFRQTFWGDREVDTCYAQNVFLYVKRGCPLYQSLVASGRQEIRQLPFLNCVHPVLYDVARKRGRSLRKKLARSPKALLKSLKKESAKALGKLLGRRA